MTENKMSEVAKLLGLELDEEFNIEGFPSKFKLTLDGLMGWSDYNQSWFQSSMLEKLLLGQCKIIEPVLNDDEKEYLSGVIKPFKNRIIDITKYECTLGEYLEICLRHYDDGCSCYSIVLPYFKKGTQYNGMELDKEYTLYELEL